MRARIRRDDVRIEFSGRGQIWNEILRPWLGGPEAPFEPDVALPPAALSPRTLTSPPAGSAGTAPYGQPSAAYGARQLAPSRPSPAMASPVSAMAGGGAARPAVSAYTAQPAPSAPRTWYPPKPQRPAPQSPQPQHEGGADEEDEPARIEPSNDPATLYARLAAIPGRRSEREAVLAAAWFLTKGERDTNSDEVEKHFLSHAAFPDVKVVPLLLKHVHRTKMLETGTNPRAVRLSKKGVAHVRQRLIAN